MPATQAGRAACAMACIVPCVILVNGMTGVERYYYAAARIIETVVGVAIAFGHQCRPPGPPGRAL